MSVRELLGVPLGIVALGFLLLALASPFLLIEQANEDAASLQELRTAERHIAAYSVRTGRMPSADALEGWATTSGLKTASTLSTSPLACLNGFQKPRSDKFLVGYWAGEWSECYSSPSGATTLRPTVMGLLMSGLATDIVIYLLLGLTLGWVAWRLLHPKFSAADESA